MYVIHIYLLYLLYMYYICIYIYIYVYKYMCRCVWLCVCKCTFTLIFSYSERYRKTNVEFMTEFTGRRSLNMFDDLICLLHLIIDDSRRVIGSLSSGILVANRKPFNSYYCIKSNA